MLRSWLSDHALLRPRGVAELATKQFLRAQIIYSVTPEERKMQGLKSRSSAQRFLPAHAPASNAFNAISFQQSHTKLFEPGP